MALIDYYAVLDVARNADQETIKKAYREKQIKCHPDKHAQLPPEFQQLATDMSKKINEAYEVLKDSEKRAAYDQALKGNDKPSNTGSAPASEASRDQERRRYEQQREERERRERAEQEEREKREAARARRERERAAAEAERIRREREEREAEERRARAEDERARIRSGKKGNLIVVIVFGVIALPFLLMYAYSHRYFFMSRPYAEIMTFHGWIIGCEDEEHTHRCSAEKGKLRIYHDAGSRFDGAIISGLSMVVLDVKDGPEIGSLTIDGNTPISVMGCIETCWRADGDQLTGILSQMFKGKRAKIHVRSKKTNKIEDTMVDLENFSEVYATFERIYHEWFK